ncbi:hypothetical protein ACMXYY_13405, partial [Acinetobacter courvalinii]
MADKTEISKPVEIKDNSVERVALELMEKIAFAESRTENAGFKKPNPREYYLKSYNQSHKVVSWPGNYVKDVLSFFTKNS